ncbi:ABC-type transport system involved in multi-copper enzyme maturation, permease component [Pragia fontium]|uniref:putative ABC transporter permease subunit YbbP n=1 Tax=Pragia fontium TaxID=82985 RepID=UPI000E025B5C|nr:putative ABC transporter permease subunit YbbP [Pragia fontium]SUB81977.1 ABC-type transport system involved in multi-copper enzyme maturation, permease component [Pragia fontium]
MIWRWFWREWRSPSLLIVWFSLTLAVACVLALGNVSDRMEQGLNQQSRDFIAADRVLTASRPVPVAWLQQAEKERLSVSRQLSFMTMAYANDIPLLASVKAVDTNYPLYGALETSPENIKPQLGTVLVAPRLLALLNSKVGDMLEVGDATLRIAGEIIQEPDSGFNPFQTAPRVLINYADIDKTGAVQPGSRLTYRYLFAGEEDNLNQFGEFITPQLQADQRWFGMEQSGTAVGKSLQRAQNFLLLSAILTLLLSVAAVAVSMSHYCRSRHNLIAVLKTLGAGRHSLRKLIIGQWLSVLTLAAVVGCTMGLLFEKGLMVLLAPILPRALPPAGIWPWFWSLGALLFISLIIGLRPYKQLLATRPLKVLREDTVSNIWPLKIYLPIVLGIVLLLLAILVGFNPMWWGALLGILVLSLALGALGWCSLLLLRRITLKSLALRLAVNRLLRQPWVTTSQLSAFSFSFMLLALLFMLRGELLDRWQQQLPPGSPNYFVMNMTKEQLPELKQFFVEHDINPGEFYPIIRVRLTQINQQEATKLVKEDDPGSEAVNRELNLTWLAADKDSPNLVTKGNWPPKVGEVSIDQGLAERLGITIGDRLTFSGDTQVFDATISSFRRVDWESLKPNFYFIFPEGALDNLPQTFLTSFRYQQEGPALVQLNRQFPTLSLLDIGSILKQISTVFQQVGRALETMVALVIVCGVLLLLAQVQVGMRQRRQELVVYRTLGAGKRLLRNTLWSEFALLGLAAGITAAIGAEVSLWWLQYKVFDFPWQPNVLMWVTLPLICAALLSLCGGWLGISLLKGQALYRRYQE